jgi:uncharacterized protein YgiM (DUF1202 family)
MKMSLSLLLGSALIALFSVLPNSAQTQDAYYIAVTNANVRAAPTTNAERVGLLREGKRVVVLGTAGGGSWYHVRLDSGQMGYIYGKLLVAESAVSDDTRPKLTGGPTPAPKDAYVYFVWPNDGDVIPRGDFWVRLGLRHMGVAPAGVEKEFTGHHHLLVDTELPPLDQEIPSDDNHIHLGRGQTEYRLQLPKGTHTLQLLLGDHNHIPHTPVVMSEQITITVP